MAAWRHIVTLFRAEGADNVTWLWTVNADTPGTGPIARLVAWPSYVTWVGIDGYYIQPVGHFLQRLRPHYQPGAYHHHKPILLSETAVSPAVANQFAKVPDLFNGVQSQHVLGLVWFDIDQRRTGPINQDWQLEGRIRRPHSPSVRAGAAQHRPPLINAVPDQAPEVRAQRARGSGPGP